MDDKNTVWFTKYGVHLSGSYISKIDYYKYKLCLESIDNKDTINILLSRYDLKLLIIIMSEISKCVDFCSNNIIILNNVYIENYNKLSKYKKIKNILIKFNIFPEKDSKGNITGRIILKTEFFHRMKILGKIKYLKPIEIKLNKEQVIDFNTRANFILL